MLKLKLDHLFFGSYLLIGIFPRLESLDVNNTQFLFLSFVALTHYLYNLYRGYNKTNYNIVIPLFFLVFCFSILSYIPAINKPESIIDSSRIFILFLILLNVYMSIKQNSSLLDLALKLICASLIIEVGAVLYNFYSIYNLAIEEKIGRVFIYKGISGNINIAGFSMVLKSMILLYYLQMTSSRFKKIILGTILVLAIFSIALTGSRGALLSMYVTMFVFLVLNIKRFITTNDRKYLLKPLHYIIPFSIVFVLTELVFNTLRMSYRTVQIIERGSASRLDYWQSTIEAMLDYPLIGLGIGNWKLLSISYGAEYIQDYVVPHHSHNDFLQIGAEIGILGGLIFLAIPLYVLYIIYRGSSFSNKKLFNDKFIFIFLAIIVYCADSSLNFPINRPIQVSTYIVLLGLVVGYYNKDSFSFINNFFRSKLVVALIALIGVGTIYVSILNFKSSREQIDLFLDYNNHNFDNPIEEVEKWEDKFPSITQTGMPIKALKAHYYWQSGDTLQAIKILKNQPYNDNPFLGVYEGALGHIYNEKNMPDSSYKYSKIAYNKLPHNLLHAAYLMEALLELEYYDELKEVFHNEKTYAREGVWYNFIKGVYNPNSNYEKDSLLIYLKEARRLFPENNFIKLAKQETEYGIANIDQAEGQANTGSYWLDEGNYEQAYINYDIAAQLLPTEFAYRQNMALAKMNLGEYDKALELLNYAIDSMIVPSKYGRIYAIRGGIFLLLEDVPSACRDFIIGVQKEDELAKNFLLNNCTHLLSKIETVE